MKEELRLLFELQQIDSYISKLHKRKIELPVEKKEIEEKLAREEQLFLAEKKRYEELQKERRRKERDVEMINSTLTKYQSQLYQVKTNKEYTAMLHEIENSKKARAALEDEILEIMIDSEELAEEIDKLNQKLDDHRNRCKEKIENIEQELKNIEIELDNKESERKKLIPTLDTELLAIYERIKTKKQGLAVVPVRKNACGGCFNTLPPQRVNEIRTNDRLITCESCGRIVVWQAW